jgi:hypothetical protein
MGLLLKKLRTNSLHIGKEERSCVIKLDLELRRQVIVSDFQDPHQNTGASFELYMTDA